MKHLLAQGDPSILPPSSLPLLPTTPLPLSLATAITVFQKAGQKRCTRFWTTPTLWDTVRTATLGGGADACGLVCEHCKPFLADHKAMGAFGLQVWWRKALLTECWSSRRHKPGDGHVGHKGQRCDPDKVEPHSGGWWLQHGWTTTKNI